MQKIPWRKSVKIKRHVTMEDESANPPDNIETAIAEAEPTGTLSRDTITESGPKTTWIWDRSRQAWVEIIEKPTADEPPEAEDTADAQTVESPSLDTSELATRDVEKPERTRKIFPSKSSPPNVLDTPAPEKKPYEWSGYATDTGQAQDAHRVVTPATVGAELEESRQLILREAEAQAEKIIAWAEERARAWADKIITQAQEKAEQRVESIIARAEEKAAIQAESIIARAEEKAAVQAESIIARAEERAEALAERIMEKAEERAGIRADSIIAEAHNASSRAEERAKAQADSIILKAEETHHQMVSAAEQQAHTILNTAQEKAAAGSRPEKMSAPPQGRTPLDRVANMGAPPRSGAPVERVANVETPQTAQQPKAVVQKEKAASTNEGPAELVIKPPVDLNIMQKALKRLTAQNQVRIIDLDGSVGKGVSVKLSTRNLDQLPDMVMALPEVEKVSELPKKLSRICPGQRMCPGLGKSNGPPVIRLLVQMHRRTAYLDTQET